MSARLRKFIGAIALLVLVTVWALLGSFDWNCLVTECRGYYEPGPFDVRSTPPRPTALARLMRELAAARPLSRWTCVT